MRTPIFAEKLPKVVSFGGKPVEKWVVLHGDMACLGLRYVPFRNPKQAVLRGGVAFLPKY